MPSMMAVELARLAEIAVIGGEAAPTAPPASPAAGCTQMPSNRSSRSSLPLATQFSATPPARQRFFAPVSFFTERASRSTISSVTAWIDAARSMCCWVSSSSGLRAGPPNSSSNFSFVMRRPVQ